MKAEKKILVVDDVPSVRMALQAALELEGYAVQQADGGPACLEACRRWHPDLVLLDVIMPGMDGHETSIEIKYDEDLKDTLILFLSADHSEESRSQGLGHGAEAYLTKPYDTAQLLQKVKDILDPVRGSGAAGVD